MTDKLNGRNSGLHIAKPRVLRPPRRGAHISKHVSDPPTLRGPHAKAWLHDTDAVRALAPEGQKDATISYWLIEAPSVSIFFHSYAVLTTHLREVPGLRSPVKYKRDATHEIVLYALNPSADRDRMLRGPISMDAMIEPCNFAAQFGPVTDDQARDVIARAVTLICAGSLSPDVSDQGTWAQIFGDNMLASAARQDEPSAASELSEENSEDET